MVYFSDPRIDIILIPPNPGLSWINIHIFADSVLELTNGA